MTTDQGDQREQDDEGGVYMTHSQMLGKVDSGGGPIVKVVLEC